MTTDVPRPSVSTIARAGVVATLASTAATVLASLVLAPLLGVDPAFQPLMAPSVAFFTAFYAIAATVVYALVARRAGRPRRTFIRLAVLAFVLLLIPDTMMLLDPSSMPFVGITTSAVLSLVVLHVIAAPIIVLALLRFAPVPD